MRAIAIGTVFAWVVAGAAAAATVRLLAVPVVREPASYPFPIPSRDAPSGAAPENAGAVERLLTRDLFGHQRNEAVKTAATDAEAPTARTVGTLVITGIAWGAHPSAVVEGIVGDPGPRLVRVGDVVAGVRIIGIAPEYVIVATADSTWTLPVRAPWDG